MNPTADPVPDPTARHTARYDTDPDALAWARTKVQHYIDRLAAFEQQATESSSSNKARGLRVARRSAEQTLIGGEGCVVGAFDERRPVMFAGDYAAPDGAAPLAYPEPITQYGFRLRDTTLLEFDTRPERDARMVEFVKAEWEVTPLARLVLPAQYGEWTEETAGAGGEQA